MKVWAFNVILCVDERFYICTVCIKVLLAICQRIYGSKLNNLTKNMHLYSYLDNLHHLHRA